MMAQNPFPRSARAVSAVALAGLLALTACEADLPDQDGGSGAGGSGGQGFDELSAPDPRGSQLSHEDMREVLEEHLSGAGITDTDDYYASLREIETELQKLAVDPTDCKQYVVQSASPVPEGALIAHADTGDAGQSEDEQDDGGQDDAEQESSGDDAADAEASAVGFSQAAVTLPLEGEDGADSEEDAEEGSGGGEDAEGEDAEEDEEPVQVELPADRQATVYTFQDWRAADAYFSGEEDGLDSCGSYTVTRGGIGEEDEPEAETSTSVDAFEVTSEADAVLGIYREIEAEGSTDHSVAVMLRGGSHLVVLTAPAGGELDEEEAEVAAEELETEAYGILSDL